MQKLMQWRKYTDLSLHFLHKNSCRLKQLQKKSRTTLLCVCSACLLLASQNTISTSVQHPQARSQPWHITARVFALITVNKRTAAAHYLIGSKIVMESRHLTNICYIYTFIDLIWAATSVRFVLIRAGYPFEIQIDSSEILYPSFCIDTKTRGFIA